MALILWCFFFFLHFVLFLFNSWELAGVLWAMIPVTKDQVECIALNDSVIVKFNF